MNRGLPKSSRLYLRNDIKALFEQGCSFSVKPVKCYYRVVALLDEDRGEGVKLMVSAPKRYLKRAVHRNFMKRRLREAFRLNRELLCMEELSLGGDSAGAFELHVALMYNRGELMEYDAVEGLVVRVLGELSRRLESLRCR